MTDDVHQQAIDRAVRYLRSKQQSDGGFASYSSPNAKKFSARYTYHTTFVPALMLQALSRCEQALEVRGLLADFLLAAKGKHGSYNYWAPDSAERKKFPYPDDLDDTFCALHALWHHDKSLVDGEMLAQMVKILIAAEEQPGGPYKTWLAKSQANVLWDDIDVAVNANVAYFLRLIGSPLPSLAGYLEQAIIAGDLSSPYYPSRYPLIYYLARAYDGTAAPLLTAELKARQLHGYWQSPLQTALAISAFVSLPNPPEMADAQAFLLRTQQEDGSWPAEAFCLDPTRDRRTYYQGAAALTTALVIEALTSEKPKPQYITARSDDVADRLHAAIVANAEDHFAGLQHDLSQQALRFTSALLERDKKREITLLPYFFMQSLQVECPVLNNALMLLGMASLYGWVAYTIYDDFLDDEGKPALLSVANVCLRSSLVCFQKAVAGETFQQYVLETFNTIDSANTWEVEHCRFVVKDGMIAIRTLPDYGDRARLADRSLGHALAPLALLSLLGDGPGTPAGQQTETMLRQYLIARQTDDDLHDWEDDLRAGRISFVVAYLLDALRIKPGSYTLEELVTRMERQFWNDSLPRLCDLVDEHLVLAHQAKPDLLKQSGLMDTLFDKIAKTMDRTRSSQANAKKFLKSYQEE